VITREDFYGRRKEWLIWVPLIFGPPLLAVYCLKKFQLVNPDDRRLLWSGLIGYGAAFVVLLIVQRKAFPWRQRAPVWKWVGLLVVPVPGAFLGVCFFLSGNALLDRSKPKDTVRLVDERWSSGEYVLMSERKVISGERLQPHWSTPPLARGTRVVLSTRDGFFGAAWIADYRIQE
jgi:hypothetical protein